ncbi:unnamed protein product [Adineta ricciae]|uniref:Uncharacterized protein n=1 Tax=Adineta ricciae TaxID=249248 RepID=A0A815W701_ADIRI|nr:unnamed protein product [Adineta ricciae]CAF1546099.1 unnamed protein product [Adineta ricciae]
MQLISVYYSYYVAETMNNRRNPTVWQKSLHFIRAFNHFPSVPPSVNERALRNERISTRLFIFLLVLSSIILLLYNSLINVITIETAQSPPFEQYRQLYKKYPQTLTCPCQSLLIDYEHIFDLDYTLHQVCTSIFTTQQWTDYLFSSKPNHVYSTDFRVVGSYLFESLDIFCQLVNRTIRNDREHFWRNHYVSAIVTPMDLFKSQIETYVHQLRSSATNNFILSLNLLRNTTHINALLSPMSNNFHLSRPLGSNTYSSIPTLFDNCRCDISAMCLGPSAILEYPSGTPKFYVPGVYQGCYTVEALLHSTLECFYNYTCLQELQLHTLASKTFYVMPLNSLLKSKYPINSTIEQLLDQLMIEEWTWSSHYEQYYNHCRPVNCTYSYRSKNGLIYIATTSIGLLGGLVTVLEFTIPRLVKFIDWIILARRQRRIVSGAVHC